MHWPAGEAHDHSPDGTQQLSAARRKMLEEFPRQSHPSRLFSPLETWRWKPAHQITHLPHLLLMETAWVLGNRHTHQHLHREPAGRVCDWLHTALCSCDLSGLGITSGRCYGVWVHSSFQPFPCAGHSHSPVLSTAGVGRDTKVLTLPASISLIRTCMLCLGPCFFWSWINTEEMGDGVWPHKAVMYLTEGSSMVVAASMQNKYSAYSDLCGVLKRDQHF